MIKRLMICTCLLLAIACSPPEDIKPVETNDLEILWSTQIVPEGPGFHTLGMSPVLFEDHLIVSTEYNLNGHTAPILWLDTSSGEIDTMWSDYVYNWDYYTDEDRAVSGDYLLLGGLFSVDCINMKSASTQWGSMFDDGYAVLYTNNGYVYRTMNYSNQNGDECAAILRTSVQTANWDTVYRICASQHLRPSFISFDFALSPNGDELLIAKNRTERVWSGANGRTTILAYNLTADSLEWESERLESFCGFTPLQVHGESVYGMLDTNFVALGLEDGSLKWKAALPNWQGITNNLQQGDFHVHDGRIILKGSSPYIACLDSEVGELLWTAADEYYHNLHSRFQVYQDRIYCSNYGLSIIDVNTGKRAVSKKACDKLGSVQGDIVLDPARGVMYMQNGKEALCVRIPE